MSACVRLRVEASLNVSQQSLLISAEAVAEALSRQGCMLRREGDCILSNTGDSSTPPIYGQYPRVTHTNAFTHGHIHMRPAAEHYHFVLHGEKKMGRRLPWWMLQRPQYSKRWYTAKYGDAFLQKGEGRQWPDNERGTEREETEIRESTQPQRWVRQRAESGTEEG